MKISRSGSTGSVRVERRLEAGQELTGLNELLDSGQVLSYAREEDRLVAFAASAEDARRLRGLAVASRPTRAHQGLRAKLVDFLVPSDLANNCAPEYARFRAWSLASSLLSGVIGFMTSAVYIESLKVAFSTSEKAALSGVITGTIGKVAQTAGYSLSAVGDADPKRGYLISSLVGGVNSIVGLGLLAVVPQAHLPLFCATALTGTLAGIAGSASSVNIFNHMAPGQTKGEVATKNGNQTMLASCFGMPGGLAMGALTRSLGWNPGLAASCLLGPPLLYCLVQAGRSIRMEPVGWAELGQLVDGYLEDGQLPEAENPGLGRTLLNLFRRSRAVESPVELAERLDDVIGPESTRLFGVFREDNYLVGIREGKVRLALRSGFSLDDALRGYLHARLVQRGLEAGWSGGDVELVELTARAVPKELANQLPSRGWHGSVKGLKATPLDAIWQGPELPRPSPLTVEQLDRELLRAAA